MQVDRQPDQESALWSDHVSRYEEVFETLTTGFAEDLLARMRIPDGATVLDVAAGTGVASLSLAARGCSVAAIDFSPSMIARIAERAEEDALSLDARVMDGEKLDFSDDTFDSAVSVLGVILFPDPLRGLMEMRRVVRPGGSLGLVTWTEPDAYELTATLRAAIAETRSKLPRPTKLPAQLRFVERETFAALFFEAGLEADIVVVERSLSAPSARWLADRIAFAPGMAALVETLGVQRGMVLDAFVRRVETRHGSGVIRLASRAFLGIARVP